tara:strand:- start:3365 stop:3592 length:228 start_codon:yes stop_codon:yes gene_type:complete
LSSYKKKGNRKVKAIKILLDEEEMSVIDSLVEELVKATKIKATRTAIVKSIFKNGLEFYTLPHIISESHNARRAT